MQHGLLLAHSTAGICPTGPRRHSAPSSSFLQGLIEWGDGEGGEQEAELVVGLAFGSVWHSSVVCLLLPVAGEAGDRA